MQHTETDTDIDRSRDDDEAYPESGWGRLVNSIGFLIIVPAILAVVGEYADLDGLLHGSIALAVLFMAVTVFALVMEYRHDQRILANPIDDKEV